MIEFENYKNNIEIKHHKKSVDADEAACYSGDIDILKKYKEKVKEERKRPLAAAIVGIDNTIAPLPSNNDCHTWTDIDTQELFLRSKPTCYLILCKPGSDAFNLGEAISKKYNCVHLSPRIIIDDELAQKTSTGICLDFNMKHNKAITYETFLKMLKIKVESLIIQHRGYVISGFPILTCTRSLQYLVNTLHGEESVSVVGDILFDILANLNKKKKKVHRVPTGSPSTSVTSETEAPGEDDEDDVEEEPEPEENQGEEEEELKVELPKFLLDQCFDVIYPTKAYFNTKKVMLLKQLDDLFSLKLKPDIVIYLNCPDKTMILKNSHRYFDYRKQNFTFDPFYSVTTTDIRWPPQYVTLDDTNVFEKHSFSPKYAVRQPNNFEHKSIEQMCNYNRDLLPFLEKKLKEFDPKHVIKVDARITHNEMFREVSERLLIMGITPIIIPEPLYIEEVPDEIDEFWDLVEKQNVIHSGSAKFNRHASPWFNRCPVELKKRICVKGNPKLAIAFFNYVYLPATLENFTSFYKNPRPYLKLEYLKPTCRMIVIGTILSGKTMISDCLSWLFDTPVINYNNILQKEITKKYDVYTKTVLSEIIATIEDDRLAKWQNAEMKRLASLEEWCQSKIVQLKKYIPLLKEYSIQLQKIQKGKKRRREATETEEEIEETPPIDTAFMNKYNTMRSILSFLPFLDDLNECQNALSIDIISKYASLEIKKPKEKPKLPMMGDDDVTAAIKAYIMANELQKEIYPTTEEVMSIITNIITEIDSQHQKHTNMDEMYGTYIIDGFPSDIENWNILVESNLLPDYTIALVENREIDSEIIEYYKNVKSCTQHNKEIYILANDPLINLKLNNQKLPDLKNSAKNVENDLVNESVSQSILDEKKAVVDSPETEPWISFSEKIEKFKEDWDTIKIKLEDDNKCFIDVELENKSDTEIVEEVMLKIRKCYYLSCEVNEDEEFEEPDNEKETPKDMVTYNNPVHFGETGMYCPISYYTHRVLWEGKPEFSVTFDSKLYRLSKEENLEPFQNDVTKYQSYSNPFKTLPPLRVCVIGCIGSGKTTVSKLLAKELGLMHLDFSEILNDMLIPKHFKKVGLQYENSFTDVPIDDEAVVEFQMDEGNENLISDIMSSETELRKMIYSYLERGSQILPQLMQKLLTKLWFEDPFVKTGFILDGYPKLPTDIEDMVTCYCIPDLIIEIESSSEKSLERLSPKMLKTWKMQLNEAKEKSSKNLKKEKKEWMDFLTKNVVAKLICDEILDTIFLSSEPIRGLSVESVLIDANPSGTVIDVNLFNTLNDMMQEFPEPVDQSEWEKAEDVRERIDARLEGIYESDSENIEALKDLLEDQRIKIVSINGNKSLTKVTRLALSKVTYLRNRNESFFEETVVVSPEVAEALLLGGFCILSNRFNRMCPVHIFENPSEIQNIYKISQRKNTVFPVVHRSYMYFMYGQENLKKFRTNPLKYVTDKNICSFEQYPLRISVIGAPKSGKSTLSAKLAKRHGLLCLSKGIAVRNVLDKKPWTELAAKMSIALTAGECISIELVMKAVKMMAMNHRVITNGFVFDGIPETAAEAMVLIKDGIYPDIVLDISADKKYVGENSQKEIYYDLLKVKPPYSRSFIENRYEKWQDQKYNIREWIGNDYQNLYYLDGNKSKWDCLNQTTKVLNDFCTKVHHYLTHVKTDIVLVDFLCISNVDFEQRMSVYKHMCPLCYHTHNLKHNGNPVIKKGIVQYHDKFYWICPDHINTVLKNPLCLRAHEVFDIPELPLIVKTVNMALVYEKGICIVTYAEHLPAQKLAVGTVKYAASYKGNRYLFCSKTCHDKFLAKPHLYYDITVFKNAVVSKPLTLKGLPDIGYLEQTVGIMITEACVAVTIHRPKYPGLTYQLSALLYIALFLKTHNPKISKDRLEIYKKASEFFDKRCKIIPHVGLFLRSMDNPFATYPKCCDFGESDAETILKPLSHSEGSSRRSLTYSDTLATT